MKTIDYIIISILITFSWAAEYLFYLAPEGINITPFAFADKSIYSQWFIWLCTNSIRVVLYPIIILMIQKKKLHWITIEVVIMTAIIAIFDLLWFLLFYNNPFTFSVLWIKIITIVIIYFSIYSVRWHGKRNSNPNTRDCIRKCS